MPSAKTREYRVKFSEQGAKRLESATKRIDSGFAGLTKSAKAIGGALAAAFSIQKIKQGFEFAVKASLEQEEIFRRLQTQIELTGKSYSDLSADINTTFAQIQKFTEFGDTDSAKVLTQLIALTGDFDLAYRNLGLALDLASTPLFEVESATRAVGMALTGNIDLLGRYIPEFKTANNEWLKTASAADKAAFAVDVLTEKFGGAAQENVKTTAGAIKQFNNEIGDLAEKVGDVLAPTIEKSFGDSTRLVNRFNQFLDNNKEALIGVIDKFMEFGENVVLVASPFNALIQAFNWGTRQTEELADETDKYGKLLPDVVQQQKAFVDSINNTIQPMVTLTEAQRKQLDGLKANIDRLRVETDTTQTETQKQIALIEMKYNRDVKLAQKNDQLIAALTTQKYLELEKITRDAWQREEKAAKDFHERIETAARTSIKAQLDDRKSFVEESNRLWEGFDFKELDADQLIEQDLLVKLQIDKSALEAIKLRIPVGFDFSLEAKSDLAAQLSKELGIEVDKIQAVLDSVSFPKPGPDTLSAWERITDVVEGFQGTFEQGILRQWREGGGLIKNLADTFIEQIERMVAAILARAAILGIFQLLGVPAPLTGGLASILPNVPLTGGGGEPRTTETPLTTISRQAAPPPAEIPLNLITQQAPPPAQVTNIHINAVDPATFEDFMRRGGAEITVSTINELV